MQEGPYLSSEIEEEETEAPIPVWLQFLDVEAATLLEYSE
jgi:hypothetical protein